jgi:hypothetical protein
MTTSASIAPPQPLTSRTGAVSPTCRPLRDASFHHSDVMTMAGLDGPSELRKVNYLPMKRFPCQGVDHRWCRERRDSEVSRTFVHGSSSAPSRIESAAHTPSRVSRRVVPGFRHHHRIIEIPTGFSQSEKSSTVSLRRRTGTHRAVLGCVCRWARLYRRQAIARGLRLLRSPAKMACVRESTAPSLFVTVTLLPPGPRMTPK